MPKAGTPLTFAEGSKVFWDNSAKTCKASSAEYYCIPRSPRRTAAKGSLPKQYQQAPVEASNNAIRATVSFISVSLGDARP
jgi:hypothetical protein